MKEFGPGSPNLTTIFLEISCGRFSWKLNDKIGEYVCQIFATFFANVSKNFRQNFALGTLVHNYTFENGGCRTLILVRKGEVSGANLPSFSGTLRRSVEATLLPVALNWATKLFTSQKSPYSNESFSSSAPRLSTFRRATSTTWDRRASSCFCHLLITLLSQSREGRKLL